jgi:acetolactate synthase-1/2/3 large subunit
MKASDYIAAYLASKKVPAVFELSGGMITHLLDSLHTDARTKIVSMHHEQGAAFAAEAAGRMTGIPGVAMATSGPGATNLLTGVGSCYFDSSPAVFITGQVNLHEQKGARAIRQLGFQEANIVAMAQPLTKRATMVRSASELPTILDEAFTLACSGRPGPVLIDIPMDVQRDPVNEAIRASVSERSSSAGLQAKDLNALADALLCAKKPLILAGGGIRAALAGASFRELADALGIPVVHSLMGVDLLPYTHPLNVGMIGSYGNRWANLSLHEADCLLVLGSRLDVRQTGAQTAEFKGSRPIFHVDCEAGEMNNRIVGCHEILSELAPAIAALRDFLGPLHDRLAANTVEWRESINAQRARWPDTAELSGVEGINPNLFMHQLSQGNGAFAYVVDVGQHQMWAAQSLELQENQRFLTSGGMGSMGFALPAAVGAAVCTDGAPVVCIAGDGAFQCNIQELQTIVRLGLNVKIVVINNQCHGMVRQFQESYFAGRYQSTMWGYSAPDFGKVAEAYGIPARTVASPCDVEGMLRWLNTESVGPALLQVMISPNANAYPKLAFGHGMSSMEPQIKPLDMEGT